MTYQAIDIAKYIITSCNNKDLPVSNLKLQKMLYYAWIDYYKATGTHLFDNEICAWKFGPVVPDVYYEFCSFAGNAITREYNVALDVSDQKILDDTISKYIDMPVYTLVAQTHKEGGPWDTIFANGAGASNPIPFSLIAEMECVE